MRRNRLSSRHRAAQSGAIIVLSLLISVPAVWSVGQEFIPLENWSYRAAERLETLGLCSLPGDRPFTRAEFIAITAEIVETSKDRRLAARDRYDIARLEKEFSDFASRRDPQRRYDPPTIYLNDEPIVLQGDVDIQPSFENAFFSSDNEAFVTSNPEFQIHWKDHVTYDVRYRLILGPEHGTRARNERPSARERSFKGLTSLYERSYVIAGGEKGHIFFGREYVDWGPSDFGNLATPGDTYGVDQLGARVKLKRFRLSFLNGLLSLDPERRFAAHRLELGWKRWVFGINETVVYAGRGFDPIYALPLSSFYANQFNERGDDNVLWSVDVKTSPIDGLLLYSSLLIDDFQFERDGENPDKLGFDVGGRYAMSWPIAATVRARFRFVDVYTYTHKDSLTSYVSGDGLIDAGNVALGGDPGPDSDSWRVEAEVYPLKNVIARAAVFGERRGEGNDFRRHLPGDDPTPTFPLGITQRSRGVAVGMRWEFDRNKWVDASYSYIDVKNAAHVAGLDDSSDAFRLAIHWELL